MKYKRTLCFVFAVLMILTILPGRGNHTKCIAEQSNTAQEIADAENTYEIIEKLEIPDLWKRELQHAIQLDMPMDKVQQENVSGKEMMELLDWSVAYAAPETLNDWKNQLPALRNSEAALSRFDAMTALFLAAEQSGGIYSGYNYDIMEMAVCINQNWDVNYVS